MDNGEKMLSGKKGSKKATKTVLISFMIIILSFGTLELMQRIRYCYKFRSSYWLKYGFVTKPDEYNYRLMLENAFFHNIKNVEASIKYFDGYFKNNPRCTFIKKKINSMGFRGKEIGAKYEYRIVILGGSTTYGAGVEDGFTYPEYMHRKLNREVINAGIPNATIDNILNLFEKDIVRLAPDRIIANCLINNLSSSKNMVRFNILQKLNQKLLTKSLFYLALREKICIISKKRIDEIHTTSLKTALIAFMKDDKFYENLKEKHKKIIRLAHLHNIKVIIVKEPVWLRDNRKEKCGMLLDIKFSPVWDRLYLMLDAIGKEEGIKVIDVNSIPKTADYFIDGLHLTELGNEYIANVIAEQIRNDIS